MKAAYTAIVKTDCETDGSFAALIKSVHCQSGDLCRSCCEVKVGENNKNQLVSVPKEMLKTSGKQEQPASRKMTHRHKLLTTSTPPPPPLAPCVCRVEAET